MDFIQKAQGQEEEENPSVVVSQTPILDRSDEPTKLALTTVPFETVKMSHPPQDPLEKAFVKGTKTFLIATEIAQHFNGETSTTEVTPAERQALCSKYQVDRDTITSALTGLRTIGLYRDRFYRARQPLSKGLPEGIQTHSTPSDMDPKGVTPAGTALQPVVGTVTTPPTGIVKASVEVATPPTGTGTAPTGVPSLPTGTQTASPTTQVPPPSLPTAPPSAFDPRMTELMGIVTKQQEMINDLSGQLKTMTDRIQRGPLQTSTVSVEGTEEPQQIFEISKDMLIRKVMWWVPKIMTYYQLYVEDAQKKGDGRPPTFVARALFRCASS